MLKKKHHTTPLTDPGERAPLRELPVSKPGILRGVVLLMELGALLSFILKNSILRRSDPLQTAIRFRALFESFGGMWMKLGQVMSMRTDLFSPEFCNELLHLQDKATSFPGAEARRRIEASLGCTIEDIFDHYEERPFAAASLSQVHRAFLREQQMWIVIKVQRPFSRAMFRHDFFWLSLTFGLLEKLRIGKNFRWSEMLEEVQNFMEEELDYRNEAAELKRMRKLLKSHKIYVPKVVQKYATETVLVIEYLPAVFVSDYVRALRENPRRLAAWIEENDLEPKKIARRLIQSLLRQMFEDFSFHGDLHPGNIVLLRNNRIAFIDFGSIGRLDRDFISRYDQYTRAMAAGNLSTAADMFLLFAGSLPDVDPVEVKRELVKALQHAQRLSSIDNIPFQEKSLAATSARINALVFGYGFDMNWGLLKLGRTFAALDQTIGVLHPTIDYVKETKRYYIDAAERRSVGLKDLSGAIQKVSDITNIAMPLLTSRAVQFKGTLSHGARLMVFLMGLVWLAFGGLLLVVGWAYLYQRRSSLVTGFHLDHASDNRFLLIVESMPKVGAMEVFAVGLVVLLITRFVSNLKKPSFGRRSGSLAD